MLLVFGAKKLKTIGSDLGSAVRGFKKSMSEGEEEGSQADPARDTPDAEFAETDAKTSRRTKAKTAPPELRPAAAMFEVGFTELLVIFVLALVVLGPEKLPRLAAQVGRWIGRARAMARQFREQLEEEVNVADLNKWQQQNPPPPPQATRLQPPPRRPTATPPRARTPARRRRTLQRPRPRLPQARRKRRQPHRATTPARRRSPKRLSTSRPPMRRERLDAAHGASAGSSPGVESTPADTHTHHTTSHDTAASPDERPARPGDVITQTHERGI